MKPKTKEYDKLEQEKKDLIAEEALWEFEKDILLRKYSIKKEKQSIKRSFIPKVSTTKLLMAFLFANCTVLEVFTLFITLKEFDLAFTSGYSPDFTPLITLISVVVGEVIAFAVYAVKAMRENSKGGVVYETAMKSLGVSNEEQGQG